MWGSSQWKVPTPPLAYFNLKSLFKWFITWPPVTQINLRCLFRLNVYCVSLTQIYVHHTRFWELTCTCTCIRMQKFVDFLTKIIFIGINSAQPNIRNLESVSVCDSHAWSDSLHSISGDFKHLHVSCFFVVFFFGGGGGGAMQYCLPLSTMHFSAFVAFF